MALKKAIVTFTNEHGDVITRHLPIKSVVFDYQNGFVEVIYAAYASDAARLAGAQPDYISQKMPVDPTDQSEMGLVLAVSDALWAKIIDAPFITDHAGVDAKGNQTRTVKSLNELGAEIVDA